MDGKEKEYMDYLIHNRMQLTNQITKHLDQIDLLQKKLDIATKALKEYANCKPTEWMSCVTAEKALKEMEEI